MLPPVGCRRTGSGVQPSPPARDRRRSQNRRFGHASGSTGIPRTPPARHSPLPRPAGRTTSPRNGPPRSPTSPGSSHQRTQKPLLIAAPVDLGEPTPQSYHQSTDRHLRRLPPHPRPPARTRRHQTSTPQPHPTRQHTHHRNRRPRHVDTSQLVEEDQSQTSSTSPASAPPPPPRSTSNPPPHTR